MQCDDRGAIENLRHWRDIAHRIVWQLVNRSVGRIACRYKRHSVAIGRGTYGGLDADGAATARAIIDDYLPAERFRKALRDEAGGNIRAAAGRERDDQPDRFGRVQILCACANRGKRDEYSENCDYARHGFLRHHVSRQFLRRGLDVFKLFAERSVVHRPMQNAALRQPLISPRRARAYTLPQSGIALTAAVGPSYIQGSRIPA